MQKNITKDVSKCADCRIEHRQLADWLIKLSIYESLEYRAKNLFGENYDLQSCVEELRKYRYNK